MNEDNEKLLQQFFSDAAHQQIADDGFTERVMQRIAATEGQWSMANIRRFNRLWTWFCIAVFVALFVMFRGWELLAVHFEVMVRTLFAESFSINPLMLFTVLFGLLFVGVGEAVSRA